MNVRRTIRSSLRVKLLLAHLLIIMVGVSTMLLAIVVLAPRIFDRLVLAMMGPTMPAMNDMMMSMQQIVTAAFRTTMLQALLFSASAATFAALAISLFVSHRLVTPVQHLLAASRRVARGHYAERVPVRDADELGDLARQFNTMAAELEGVERRRVALIGDIAHELRTPLATIEGYTEGVLDGVVAPDDATWALIHDEVGRMRRLVNDLQELSRAEARQLPLHMHTVAPASVIEQACARMRAQFADKGITLTTTMAPDLPPVQADNDRIVQVLINLLGNAVRYTPAGGSVDVGAARDGNTVVFRVADSGIGIAPDHLPHLFERFYRVDPARSRSLGGSGIGLSVAKALVEAHGGQIWATSPGLGQGAAFSFSLPTA